MNRVYTCGQMSQKDGDKTTLVERNIALESHEGFPKEAPGPVVGSGGSQLCVWD